MYDWLTVEDDGEGRAVRSYLTGYASWQGVQLPFQSSLEGEPQREPVARGSVFHQDLVRSGWVPVWVRKGKSVWKAPSVSQALSDYWLLRETEAMSKEK